MSKLVARKGDILILIFIVYLILSQMPLGAGTLRFAPSVGLIIIAFCGLLCLGERRNARLGILVFVSLIYITFSALINPTYSSGWFITFIKSSYWCWVYYISYSIFSRSNNFNNGEQDGKIMLIVILFAVTFFYMRSKRIVSVDVLLGDNAVFYSLMMLPWIASVSNNTKRWILFFIIATCSIIGLKRSSIIIMLSSFILMYYGEFIYHKKVKAKTIIPAIIIVLCVGAFISFNKSSISNVVQRFDMIEEDGGSNRDFIYAEVFAMYEKGDYIQKVFGQGFDSVRGGGDTSVALSAHNDFLEVLYDYGLIGFLFYLLIHLSIIRWCIRLFKERSQLSFPMLISYSCFFFMSMLSHLVLYPTYFGLLVSFWAFAECKDRELKFKSY